MSSKEPLSKKEKILATAGKLFMQNGFMAVSMDQIASAVPVSKPTLYTNFKDKRELFGAVIDQRCRRALTSLRDDILDPAAPEKSLGGAGRLFLDLVLEKESLRFHRVIMAESESFPEMAKLFYETGPKQMHALLRDYLATLNKNGFLKIENPDLAADIFLGMIKGRLHTRSLLGVGKPVTRQERADLVDTAVRIFINGQKT